MFNSENKDLRGVLYYAPRVSFGLVDNHKVLSPTSSSKPAANYDSHNVHPYSCGAWGAWGSEPPLKSLARDALVVCAVGVGAITAAILFGLRSMGVL